jgi:hypothetical protein
VTTFRTPPRRSYSAREPLYGPLGLLGGPVDLASVDVAYGAGGLPGYVARAPQRILIRAHHWLSFEAWRLRVLWGIFRGKYGG